MGNGALADQNGYALQYHFEWMPLTSFGKAGIGLGVGAFVLPNRLIKAGDPNTDDTVATLYAFPIEVFLSYRFDFYKGQPVVPYFHFGPPVTFAYQHSNFTLDGLSLDRSWFGSKTLNYGAGIEIYLNWIDGSAAKAMELSYGINTAYFTVEYLKGNALGTEESRSDLSHSELRFGLRFEM